MTKTSDLTPLPATPRRRLNLALQGGGAHGAFTWGVLDRLLEADRFEIGWISGTSAGAINAAALASGLLADGTAGARTALSNVWSAVVKGSVPELLRFNPFLAGSLASFGRSGPLAQVAQTFSPYDFNPLGIDPIRRLLEANIDVARLRREPGSELLIAATRVSTGDARLFRRAELSIDAVLASACLPTLHHAVMIDGAAYWDGGFSANPDLLTLATESPVPDTLVVQIDPLSKPGVPTSAREIAAHINHLTFTRPYLTELQAIARARRAALPHASGWRRWLANTETDTTRIARHRFHIVEAGWFTGRLPAESKAKPEQALISYLFQAGRTQASKWLEQHADAVGERDTAEIERRLDALQLPASPAATQSTDDVISDAAQ